MSDLSKLNDKQSLLLTQLSYYSDILSEQYEHKSIKEIYDFEKADVADEDLINCLETLCDNGLGVYKYNPQVIIGLPDLVLYLLRIAKVIPEYLIVVQTEYLLKVSMIGVIIL